MSQPDTVSVQTATSRPIEAPAPNLTENSKLDPVLARLQSQQRWYSQSAQRSRRWFTAFKVISIIAAAAIPVLAGFGGEWLGSYLTLALGLLGAVIVIIEGLLRLFQWEQHWLNYRTTKLALDREHALYLAAAGPYAESKDARRLLAETVEDLLSRENQSWSLLHQEKKGKDSAS
jgi:hypothetical protein